MNLDETAELSKKRMLRNKEIFSWHLQFYLKKFTKVWLKRDFMYQVWKMVGLGGLEPPTSPLSGVRSNQAELQTQLNWKEHFTLQMQSQQYV